MEYDDRHIIIYLYPKSIDKYTFFNTYNLKY